MNVLGSDVLTADGSVTIPDGTIYVVAVGIGSESPLYLNGVLMETKGSVPATGVIRAVGMHVSRFPPGIVLPFNLNGNTSAIFIYLDDAICTRGKVIEGHSTSGTESGDLPTSSTDDIVIGVVIGEAGQVTLKGDGANFTLLLDTSLIRIGYIVPGDDSLACEGKSATVAVGYWQPQDPIKHPATLIEDGHYDKVTTRHDVTFVRVALGYYDQYIDGGFSKRIFCNIWDPTPADYYYNIITQVWQNPVYSSEWWEYPPPVWIPNSPGQVSAIFISIADVMIGGIFVTRPRIG